MQDGIDWLAPFSRWQTWLGIASNLLPLLGIFYLNWDASTLIILYWMETAVVGFWLMMRLVFTRDIDLPMNMARPQQGLPMDGIALAIFLTLHAGIFMGGHLFFLFSLAPGEWSRHLASPIDFVFDFVVPSGVWIPLAALFAYRGAVTVGEIVKRKPVGHLIAGFYARIIVMQLVILFGGMVAVMLGSPVALLVLIVAFKTAFEIYWERFAHLVEIIGAGSSRKPQG